MNVQFICDGFVVMEEAMHYIPDNEDRIKIEEDYYIVDDRMFIFTKRQKIAKVFLTKISE